jgi:hypothetical protein
MTSTPVAAADKPLALLQTALQVENLTCNRNEEDALLTRIRLGAQNKQTRVPVLFYVRLDDTKKLQPWTDLFMLENSDKTAASTGLRLNDEAVLARHHARFDVYEEQRLTRVENLTVLSQQMLDCEAAYQRFVRHMVQLETILYAYFLVERVVRCRVRAPRTFAHGFMRAFGQGPPVRELREYVLYVDLAQTFYARGQVRRRQREELVLSRSTSSARPAAAVLAVAKAASASVTATLSKSRDSGSSSSSSDSGKHAAASSNSAAVVSAAAKRQRHHTKASSMSSSHTTRKKHK